MPATWGSGAPSDSQMLLHAWISGPALGLDILGVGSGELEPHPQAGVTVPSQCLPFLGKWCHHPLFHMLKIHLLSTMSPSVAEVGDTRGSGPALAVVKNRCHLTGCSKVMAIPVFCDGGINSLQVLLKQVTALPPSFHTEQSQPTLLPVWDSSGLRGKSCKIIHPKEDSVSTKWVPVVWGQFGDICQLRAYFISVAIWVSRGL